MYRSRPKAKRSRTLGIPLTPKCTVAARSRTRPPFVEAAAGAHAPERVPGYLRADHTALAARLLRLPEREEIPATCDEQLVVEYYSR